MDARGLNSPERPGLSGALRGCYRLGDAMDGHAVRCGFLCAALGVSLLSCAACSRDESVPATPNAPSTTAALTAAEGDDVMVTLPLVFFEGTWEEDPQRILDDYHCSDVEENDDGSYTVKLSRQNYDALIERAYIDAKTAIDALVHSDDHPHVTAVDYDEQFGTVTVTLDTSDLSVVEGALPYIPGGIACGYQLMAGLPVRCDVILVGPDGADLLDTQFPASDSAE